MASKSPENLALASDDTDASVEQQQQQYPLVRQSSMLSLTLDEIQNTVCEPGKNFGSMNMDEFLTNIWTAEEGNPPATAVTSGTCDPASVPNGRQGTSSLYQQGSLTLPSPLCRKTVDEVWSEIHQEQQQQPGNLQHASHGDAAAVASRQQTFGEMTLEDFLIKAGVVREGGGGASGYAPPPQPQSQLHPQQQSQYATPGYSMRMAAAYGNPGSNGNSVYDQGVAVQGHYQQQAAGTLEGTGFVGGKRGNGGGGGSGAKLGDVYGTVGSPVSPGSSDGFGGSQVDNSAGMWGVEMAGTGAKSGGRKRVMDGPVEKVVERRQRRMIKNRESAARSRARKQAYTVELEAELNHLKEENLRLIEEQRRLAAKRKQMVIESMNSRGNCHQRKPKIMRRTTSCVW